VLTSASLWTRRNLPVVISTLTFLLGWELICRGFGIRPFLLPMPTAIWTAVVPVWPNIAMHTMVTLRTVLLGLLASIVVSVPLAMLIASSRTISAAIYPLLVLTQSVPKVALAPILLVALGASEMSRVIITFLVAFFPLVVSSVAGLLATPPELVELGRTCRATRTQELLRIRLPYALPFVFGGLRVAAALCVVGAVVAEFVGADAGLGYLIQTSMAFFRTPVAFGAVIVLAIMGIVLFQLVEIAERLLVPWSSNLDNTLNDDN
jgi:NitT/TauT family transport system permease protein